MLIKLVVVETNDQYTRQVTVTTQPCEGYGFWDKCPSKLINPLKDASVEFTLDNANTIYITISAPDESYVWKFDVYKDGSRVGSVTVKGGYKATAFNLITGGEDWFAKIIQFITQYWWIVLIAGAILLLLIL